MFSHYFARHQVHSYERSRHKARIDQVARSLVDQRYLDVVVADHLREWLRFTTYLDAHGFAFPSDVRVREVQQYVVQRLPQGSASRLRFIRAAVRLLVETDDRGHVRRRIGTAPRRSLSAWIEPSVSAYLAFLQQHRGLSQRTVSKRAIQLGQLGEFLNRVGVKAVGGIQAKHVQGFCTQLRQKPATRLTYGVSLRSFFRWAYLEGQTPMDLSAAVVSARHFRHTGLPDVLSEEETAMILAAVDRSSRTGRRDYAVLLLAARYGMRPSDIRQLRLDDLHWRQGFMTIQQAKTGHPLTLPLLPDVREALIAYLRHGRPVTEARAVFVRHRAPFAPFAPNNNLAKIMCTALSRARLDHRSGRRGLYLFRHTLATRMLARGCPIKTIGDVLGHVMTDTTMGYAKVDLGALRRVALSEAEVRS